MSINLCFKTRDGAIIEFPFQTPTELTKKVLAENDDQRRIIIIEDKLYEWGWPEKDIENYIEEIIDLFERDYILSSI